MAAAAALTVPVMLTAAVVIRPPDDDGGGFSFSLTPEQSEIAFALIRARPAGRQ
jgi:hypothetical protein